jgi:hypothetical protein
MKLYPMIALLTGALFGALPITAQTPAAGPIVRYTAVSDNVSGAHEAIRIDVLRWSTDAEREQLLAAWNLTKPAAPGGGRGRGAVNTDPFGSFGRNRAPAADDDPALDVPALNVPALDDGGNPPATSGAPAGRGGRGGRGGAGPTAPKPTPEASLTAALGKAPVVGHLWSSEVAGYSVHSALRLAEPDGGERIIFITDRRLGAWNELWKPVAGDASNYEFSVIELRLNARGEGEGKASLTGKVAADTAAKTVALENYAGLPVVLRNVKRK